jgi:hypothetical protein
MPAPPSLPTDASHTDRDDLAFIFRTTMLLLVLDAIVAIVYYVRKRTFLTAWPPTQLPARSKLLVAHVAHTAMAVARHITAALLEFATTAAAVATSTTHCSGRRKVAHKGATDSFGTLHTNVA